MQSRKVVIMPKTRKALERLGHRIAMVRLRRDISVEFLAQKAGISRTTVWAIEKGSPSVSMGAYAKVLTVLRMVGEIDKICAEDPLGIYMQEEKLATRKRASKRSKE